MKDLLKRVQFKARKDIFCKRTFCTVEKMYRSSNEEVRRFYESD